MQLIEKNPYDLKAVFPPNKLCLVTRVHVWRNRDIINDWDFFLVVKVRKLCWDNMKKEKSRISFSAKNKKKTLDKSDPTYQTKKGKKKKLAT